MRKTLLDEYGITIDTELGPGIVFIYYNIKFGEATLTLHKIHYTVDVYKVYCDLVSLNNKIGVYTDKYLGDVADRVVPMIEANSERV